VSLGVFRRQRGLAILRHVISARLAWKAQEDGAGNDEYQVGEVQRIEGVRLALEVLSWAFQDRDSRLAFKVCRLPECEWPLTNASRGKVGTWASCQLYGLSLQ
jgi:hypothetical protein